MLFLVEVMKAIFLVSVLLELGGHPCILLVTCSRPILIDSSTLTLYMSLKHLSRHSVAQVGGRLWQADLCNVEVLRLYDASRVRHLRCEVWLSCWFACLSLQADHPQLATCMPAQSPSSHS